MEENRIKDSEPMRQEFFFSIFVKIITTQTNIFTLLLHIFGKLCVRPCTMTKRVSKLYVKKLWIKYRPRHDPGSYITPLLITVPSTIMSRTSVHSYLESVGMTPYLFMVDFYS